MYAPQTALWSIRHDIHLTKKFSECSLVLDSNGTPILAYPTEELSQTNEADIWTGTWSQAVYNGDYEISFYTKDNEAISK